MLNEYFKSIIDCVSAIECKSESQQIAKHELIEYAGVLHSNWNKLKTENQQLKEEINKISKKEVKVRDMLYSIENATLTKERLMQIEEVLFELDGNNE